MEENTGYKTACPQNIALLCGGISNEREVSFSSAKCVKTDLEESGHTVIMIDTKEPDFIKTLMDCEPDVAFIALHGKGGEDGSIQGVLELMGIPYTGSGIEASAIAMDKLRSKLLFEAAGLMTPPAVILTSLDLETLYSNENEYATMDDADNNDEQSSVSRTDIDFEEAIVGTLIDEIGLPCVVKPLYDGSSVGVSIVRTQDELQPALEKSFEVSSELLVETYIEGTEVTVPIIGNDEPDTLPVIEIIPANEFYDFESKYSEGGSRHIIPARLTPEQTDACEEAALVAHDIIGCRGFSRVDMVIDHTGIPWILEINTIPGMTATSLLPDSARVAGIPTPELYDRFLAWALEDAPMVTRETGRGTS